MLALGTVMPGVAAAAPNSVGAPYIVMFNDRSAVVPPGRLVAQRPDPRVAYIVEDMEGSISAQTGPTGIKRMCAATNPQSTLTVLMTGG